jgi:hypothetical protein
MALLAVVWVAMPLAVWPRWSRHRPTRVVVEAVIGAHGLFLVAATAGWIRTRGALDLALAYYPVAALLIAGGLVVERRVLGPRPAWPSNPAIAGRLLVYGLALLTAGCCAPSIWLAESSEPSTPGSDEVLPLPAGLRLVADQDDGCGSGSCGRSVVVASTDGRSAAQVLNQVRAHLEDARGWRFGKGDSACVRRSWLIDQGTICVHLRVDGPSTVDVSLSGSRAFPF